MSEFIGTRLLNKSDNFEIKINYQGFEVLCDISLFSSRTGMVNVGLHSEIVSPSGYRSTWSYLELMEDYQTLEEYLLLVIDQRVKEYREDSKSEPLKIQFSLF